MHKSTRSRSFTTPFKSQSSQGSICIPDSVPDDCMLWYPDGYSRSQTSISSTPIAVAPVDLPVKNVSAAESKGNPLPKGGGKSKGKNIKQTRKRKSKENDLPAMPLTPKTPQKISRIIPKTPTKSPKGRECGGSEIAPRTPTFQLYGVKHMILSQKSTPGMSPGKVLRKIKSSKAGKQKAVSGGGDADPDCNVTVLQPPVLQHDFATGSLAVQKIQHGSITAQVAVPAPSELPYPSQALSAAPKDATSSSSISGSRVIPRIQSATGEAAVDQYQFRLSPTSLRRQIAASKCTRKQELAKVEVLKIIQAMAEDLRRLRGQRQVSATKKRLFESN